MNRLFWVLWFFIFSVYANEKITIAASPVPQADILKQVKPLLNKQGVDLEIQEFSDYVLPNMMVVQGKVDANFFQHIPYLKVFNKDHGTDLVELAKVEIEPMGVYAKNDSIRAVVRANDFTKLPKGLKIAVPNDTTNEGRALLLLQKCGLIKLKSRVSYPTKNDIWQNPYGITIVELEAAMVPRMLLGKQVDVAVINSNYALDINLSPLKDAIFVEDMNSPYVNIVVVRKSELNTIKMKKLAQALHSQLVRSYINKKYQGAVIPAF